jgi:hypothetical protein
MFLLLPESHQHLATSTSEALGSAQTVLLYGFQSNTTRLPAHQHLMEIILAHIDNFMMIRK